MAHAEAEVERERAEHQVEARQSLACHGTVVGDVARAVKHADEIVDAQQEEDQVS